MGGPETRIPRLRRAETTVLIVDVQERLVPAMLDCEQLVVNCRTLAAVAVQLNLPVIVTEQYPERLGATLPEVTEALSASADTHPPFSKMLFSACTEPVLLKLNELARPTILLCGVEAHVCVMQSALDLREAGFSVFCAWDAISSRGEANKKIGWERMLQSGVVPTSTESAIFELLREAGTPSFKAMLPLIK